MNNFRRWHFSQLGGPHYREGEEGLKFDSVEQAVQTLEAEHGFIVRTKEQDETFLKNNTQTAIDGKTRELYSSFENEIERVTGVKREDGEKAYQFLERVVGSSGKREGELAAQVDDLNKQIEKLRAEGGSTKEIEELKKINQTIKNQLKEEVGKKDAEIQAMKKAGFDSRINGLISDAVSRYRPVFDTSKGEEIIEPFLQAQIATFKGIYKPVEVGNAIVWHDQNDKPMTDPKTGNNLSAYNLLEDMLKPIIKEQRKGSGTGTGAGDMGGGSGEGDKDALTELPSGITTKSQLIDHMRNALKMNHKDPQFNKIYTATAAYHKIQGL